MKKGQATAFIIIGMMILFLIALTVYSGGSPLSYLGFGSNKHQVALFVEDCLSLTTEYGLFLLGERGGNINGEPLPALVQGGTPAFLDQDIVEGELETFINENLNTCLKDFTALEGVTVTATDEPKADVFFTIKETQINLEYELEAIKDENTELLRRFKTEVPVRFLTVYEATQKVVNTYTETGGLDLGYLSSVDLETENYQEGNIIIFTDTRSKIRGQPYKFQFSLQ